MEFEVTRASHVDQEDRPCDTAKLLDRRDEFGEKVWAIEISSLADLIAFRAKHGDIIITDGANIPCINIYDNYVE